MKYSNYLFNEIISVTQGVEEGVELPAAKGLPFYVGGWDILADD